eukprot:5811937-Heterocapsa_arctica.AAC.1
MARDQVDPSLTLSYFAGHQQRLAPGPAPGGDSGASNGESGRQPHNGRMNARHHGYDETNRALGDASFGISPHPDEEPVDGEASPSESTPHALAAQPLQHPPCAEPNPSSASGDPPQQDLAARR